jgi:hypothetical protein
MDRWRGSTEAKGQRKQPEIAALLSKSRSLTPSADDAAGFGSDFRTPAESIRLPKPEMTASPFCGELLQLGGFGLGDDEDGNAGVGVLP